VVLRALRNKEARPRPGFFILIDARIAKPALVHSAGCLLVVNVRMMPAVMPNHGRLAWRVSGRLNPKRAANSAKDTADDTADNATNWSCCLGANTGAMRGTIGNALCLRRKRADKCCGDYARVQNIELHATTLPFMTGERHVSRDQGNCAATAWQAACIRTGATKGSHLNQGVGAISDAAIRFTSAVS
jgi:hypothetical protein